MDIALVGATTLAGETLVELLDERDFPVDELHLLGEESSVGKRIEFGGRYLSVRSVAGFDFSKVDLALFVAPAALAAEHAPRAVAAGARVVDASAAFRADPDVPLVVPEINGAGLAAEARLISSPTPMAVPLALALGPLEREFGLTRVSVATYQAVSESGKSAVEELGRQTADLLNLREIKTAAYPKQIAFNVLGQCGAVREDGSTEQESAILRETRVLLARPDLPVSVTAAWVPVFYGHSAAVHLETRDPVSAARAREILAAAPAIELIDSVAPDGFPTPVTDAARQDAVFVGRLREDPSHARGLNFWIVADNVRRGAALNVLKIADLLVPDDP